MAIAGAHMFAASDFGFTDPGDMPANSFESVRITMLPTARSLTLSNNPAAAGDVIPIVDHNAGNLLFAPVVGRTGMA